MNNVAGNIRKHRAERGLTQDALAERLHVTRQTVSNWENGFSEPEEELLEEIAGFFDIRLTELTREAQ